MDLELGGKTAIVTGGSRGIGKAVAREMAVEGMDVVDRITQDDFILSAKVEVRD